jgi:copper ion binding protein
MTSTHAILEVPGVSCSHCKAAIEGAVGAVDGVGQVVVDVGEKTVTIDFDADRVSLDALEAVVVEEGYEIAGRQVDAA